MRWRALVVSILLCAPSCAQQPSVAVPDVAPITSGGVQRGVAPVASSPNGIDTGPVDWRHSAGLFVGYQSFHRGDATLADVEYAADDAVDLAYLFALELNLLPPERVVLLLAGRPSKAISIERLQRLLKARAVVLSDTDAGATVSRGSTCDANAICRQLRARANAVQPDGLLVLFIATHGLSIDGRHLLLTPGSSPESPTGVALSELMQEIRRDNVTRLLLLVDACRSQIVQRAAGAQRDHGDPDPRTPTPARIFEELSLPASYGVLVAAAPGGWALSGDRENKNGVFTRAVLEGLRCAAVAGREGFVTVGELGNYVGRRVEEITKGFQRPETRFGGGLDALPLVRCAPVPVVGEILFPRQGAKVPPLSHLELAVFQPGLFATAWVCASSGICYAQNPGFQPVPTFPQRSTRIPLQFGRPDQFQVSVSLSADSGFLRGERELPTLPIDFRAKGFVHWLGPIDVTSVNPSTATPVAPKEMQP